MIAEVWMRPCVSVCGHALHAVHAGLELQARVDLVALDLQRGVLDAVDRRVVRVGDVDLPALRLGVADVHAHDLGGEERGLVAAGAGADLDEHVLLVVRILRLQQDLQLVLERRLLRLELGELHLRQLAHRRRRSVSISRASARRLRTSLQLAILRHDLLDLGDRLHRVAIGGDVGDDDGIVDLALQLFVAFFDFVEFFVHGCSCSALSAMRTGAPASSQLTAESVS